MTPDQSNNLSRSPEFTGERFIPGKSDPVLALEHYHRYLFAAHFVKGMRVLDIACGEGYGAAYLSLQANHVLGIDNDGEIIAHAQKQYAGRPNLEFRTGRCEDLALPEASIDVAVSFETLEHLDANSQELYLKGVKRSLAKGGMLLLSSPEKEMYGKSRSGPNEFHRRELTKDELLNLLKKFFGHVHMFGQDPVTVSLIRDLGEPVKQTPTIESTERVHAGATQGSTPLEPLYLLALCSDEPPDRHSLAGISSLCFEPRFLKRAPDVLVWAWRLEDELRIARERFYTLQKEFEERSSWAVSLDETLKEREAALGMLQREFDDRTAWALSLDQERARLELRIRELDALRAMLDQQLHVIKRSYSYRLLSFLGLVPK